MSKEDQVQEAKNQEQAINNGQFVKANLTEDEYGGIYIDDNNVLNVNLKDMSKKDVLKNRNIIIHSCDYSMTELKQAFELIGTKTNQLKIDYISIDEINNVVEVIKNPREQSNSSVPTDVPNEVIDLLKSSKVKVVYKVVTTSPANSN
jgi:hypothetical protein